MLARLSLPKAPPLSGEQWLNTAPLSAAMLRGRTTVVLFWAASCEASWVRLRQLEELSARHGDALAVVAVHSPRFDYERDEELLRATIEHRGLTIPVLHDPGLETWARFGPSGRPTVVVIDANQRVLGALFGTDQQSLAGLEDIVDQHANLSHRRSEDLPSCTSTTTSAAVGQLHGPAGLTRLLDGGVAVLDRGHNRLVTLELADEAPKAVVSHVFGGVASPGAMATRRDGTISVSFPDRGVIESLDLTTKKRTTIADGLVRPSGLAEDTDGSLVVCDAGADALLRVADDTTGPIATPVSQPLDVIRIDTGLLFTEASTGALRLLGDDGNIRTLNAGRRPGLLDGAVHKAMFQRPSGLATLDNNRIAIADLGNSRLRVLSDRKVTTIPVGGLAHPEAMLFLGNDRLLCSDTMNNRLVVIDLTSHRADELQVHGLPV